MRADQKDTIFYFIRITVAILVACIFTLVILFFISDDPVEAVYYYFVGPFSSPRRFGIFVSKFIPYMLTGLGMCFCYASDRFSLVGEGAYSIAGCFAAVTAILTESWELPHFVQVGMILFVCALVSALAGLPTAVLREKLKINELVTSIMMNYVLLYCSIYILKNWIVDTSTTSLASKVIPMNSRLTILIPGTTVNSGLIIGIMFTVIIGYLLYRTPLGCSIRICGANEDFAKASGISITRTLIIAQVLASVLSGLGGALDILGSNERFMWTSLTNYGFDGLMVAVLARSNPFFVPFGAFLLAYMRTGAYILNYSSHLSTEFIQVIQALIIILVAAKSFLLKFKNKITIRSAKKEMEAMKQ